MSRIEDYRATIKESGVVLQYHRQDDALQEWAW